MSLPNNRQSQDGYFQFSHLTPVPTTFEDSQLHRILGKETPSLANTSIVGFSKSSQSTSMIQPQNFMPILGEWKSFYQIGYGIQPCKCHIGNIHMGWALITLMPLLIII
jgi:hypothetical protein